MIKILHGGDFHLDSAFSSLTPEAASQRRCEQRLVLEQLSRLCQDRDLIVLSGDLFDSARIYRDTLDALHSFFSSVKGEIFIAPGNHDYLAEGSPYLTEVWGENVHIFTSPVIEKVHIQHLNCDVYGAAFVSPEMPALLDSFQVEDPEAINLMVLHGDLQPNSPYNPILSEKVTASGLDYLALGHIHAMSVQKFGRTTCAYPGCLMGRGFDECGEKGILQVSLSKSSCQTDFIPLSVRKYEILTVEAGEDPLSAILTALPEDARNDCYRILLTGEADAPDLSLLEQQLKGRFFSLSLRDHTVPKTRLWERAGEDTLRGHFLKNLKEQYDLADEPQRRKIAMAAKLVTALMDGREVSL
ncbi:MAG: metallophosphoesterase family protein [Oscillospiraceae bacterium]|nr:metallophosphoesterase family protein [Oscillospiraceae bacterium]